MELKVWVDDVQRVVCGLAEHTTCQEVIYALAHATQRTGRFVLVEKWRKSERSLSPHDRPLELLTKWGEYANDVQFVLRCLEDTTQSNSNGRASPKTQQISRPASALQQPIARVKNANQIGSVIENGNGKYRRINNSLDENNGNIKSIGPTDLSPTATRNGQTDSSSSVSMSSSSSSSPLSKQNNNQSMALPGQCNGGNINSGVLKPYFVDTSNPTPESGTLIRPISAIVPVVTSASAITSSATLSSTMHSSSVVQQPTTYEATPSSTVQQNFLVRRATGTLSPVPVPVPPSPPSAVSPSTSVALPPSQNQQYFISGPLVQRTTTAVMLATTTPALASGFGDKYKGGAGNLNVLSQSVHETLNSNQTNNTTMASNTTISSTSFDSSGATLYLESSYNSVPSQAQSNGKQLDLSQTSFCNSSISSSTSTSAFSNNGSNQRRPPPPSYDAFVQMHKRRDHLINNRSCQPSPAPIVGQGMLSTGNGSQQNMALLNRSRTPVAGLIERPAGGQSMSNGQQQMTREQLIRLIENQQYQIQGQSKTLRAYDAEIAQREIPNRQLTQTPIMEHLRRELQQLEVERVHVKQKVEELRRQNLDTQLATLRQNLAETLMESAKLEEKLKSMDAQMIMNEEKIRSISNELERERSEIYNLTASTSMNSSTVSLNDSLLASNEAFEARIRILDEMLITRKKQLLDGSINNDGDQSILSPAKVRSRSFDGSVQQQKVPNSIVELTNQQRPVENVSGVWV